MPAGSPEHSYLLFNAEDLKRQKPQVLVVGSGPAATAVSERLLKESPDTTIGMVDRGGLLLTSHVNNLPLHGLDPTVTSSGSFDERREFITAHEQYLWEGDFAEHGMMMLALGGRGLVAGAHLRRFDEVDFTLWPNGQWPIGMEDLNRYYARAEFIRNVSAGECRGRPQVWLLGQLGSFRAYAPPWGVDVRSNSNGDIGRGYDSPMAQLWAMINRDLVMANSAHAQRRLFVAPHSYVSRLLVKHSRVTGVVCRNALDPSAPEVEIEADQVVLAASTIESSRIMLNSGLGEDRYAVGRFLQDHIYIRGTVRAQIPLGVTYGECVNVIVPPPGRSWESRFQIEMRGEADIEHPGFINLRITGIAATDPIAENRVVLADAVDDFGVPKAHVHYKLSDRDEARIAVLKSEMNDVVAAIGGKFVSDPDTLPLGRSHHEVGTLRMGNDPETSATDRFGRVHGIDNLFVNDASVFPSVGVANPMLTITALGYRLADTMSASHRAVAGIDSDGATQS